MTGLPTVDALRARFESHAAVSDGGEGEAALADALEAVGWRAAGPDAVEAVATEGWAILGACVHGHGDPTRAARELAEAMRGWAPPHSDALAPADAFLPAAAEVLRHYAAGERSSPPLPPPF